MSRLPPATRATDPETSRAAEREITGSGRRDAQAKTVLDLVTAHPGSTSLELTRWTTLDRYQISRRLADLESAGAIRKGRTRACTINGRQMVTWWPVLVQAELFSTALQADNQGVMPDPRGV